LQVGCSQVSDLFAASMTASPAAVRLDRFPSVLPARAPEEHLDAGHLDATGAL